MTFSIVWSQFSVSQLDKIYTYYEEVANETLAKKIVRKIITASNRLVRNPRIGAVETLLAHRDIKYRYIVILNYKIIYSIDDQNLLVKIADIFDTRQNPVRMEQRTK